MRLCAHIFSFMSFLWNLLNIVWTFLSKVKEMWTHLARWIGTWRCRCKIIGCHVPEKITPNLAYDNAKAIAFHKGADSTSPKPTLQSLRSFQSENVLTRCHRQHYLSEFYSFSGGALRWLFERFWSTQIPESQPKIILITTLGPKSVPNRSYDHPQFGTNIIFLQSYASLYPWTNFLWPHQTP